jgi:predicted lactoylglutathione lyase
MAKALNPSMNYYEKLVKKINQSMDAHPRSAMVMDMSNFEIIAKSTDFKSLCKKLPNSCKDGGRFVVFQKPSQNVTWIL